MVEQQRIPIKVLQNFRNVIVYIYIYILIYISNMKCHYFIEFRKIKKEKKCSENLLQH